MLASKIDGENAVRDLQYGPRTWLVRGTSLHPNTNNTQQNTNDKEVRERTHSNQKRSGINCFQDLRHLLKEQAIVTTPDMEQALLLYQANCNRGESTCKPTCQIKTPRFILPQV